MSDGDCPLVCLQEKFVRRSIKKIKRRESEQEVWISGQFVSEDDMKELGIKEPRRKAIMAQCGQMKGWVRPDS